MTSGPPALASLSPLPPCHMFSHRGSLCPAPSGCGSPHAQSLSNLRSHPAGAKITPVDPDAGRAEQTAAQCRAVRCLLCVRGSWYKVLGGPTLTPRKHPPTRRHTPAHVLHTGPCSPTEASVRVSLCPAHLPYAGQDRDLPTVLLLLSLLPSFLSPPPSLPPHCPPSLLPSPPHWGCPSEPWLSDSPGPPLSTAPGSGPGKAPQLSGQK